MYLVWSAGLVLVLCSCAPVIHPLTQVNQSPALTEKEFIAHDGVTLPVKAWLSQQPTRAIMIGVHGFNDYHNAFALPGSFLAEQGITFYSYDQRGFGATLHRGLWPGKDRLQFDLYHFISTVAKRHPDIPIYLLGDSMGAAVVIATLARFPDLKIAGSILNAPAIWGGETMNVAYRLTLWLMSHTIPGYKVTGEGLAVQVSDNIPLLRKMSKDENLIRETRFDSLYGLVRIMDEAFTVAPQLSRRILILYGKKDEVIPLHSVCSLITRLRTPLDFHFYSQGYHLLLRDLQAHEVWQDIIDWINKEKNKVSDLHDTCDN